MRNSVEIVAISKLANSGIFTWYATAYQRDLESEYKYDYVRSWTASEVQHGQDLSDINRGVRSLLRSELGVSNFRSLDIEKFKAKRLSKKTDSFVVFEVWPQGNSSIYLEIEVSTYDLSPRDLDQVLELGLEMSGAVKVRSERDRRDPLTKLASSKIFTLRLASSAEEVELFSKKNKLSLNEVNARIREFVYLISGAKKIEVLRGFVSEIGGFSNFSHPRKNYEISSINDFGKFVDGGRKQAFITVSTRKLSPEDLEQVLELGLEIDQIAAKGR